MKYCAWLQRYSGCEKIERLVFVTEQYLLVNKAFIHFLQSRTAAKRVLVILDEAKIADGRFDRLITGESLRQFAEVLEAAQMPYFPNPAIEVWLKSLAELDKMPPGGVTGLKFPHEFNMNAAYIQREGVAMYRRTFEYLGYLLHEMTAAKSCQAIKTSDGSVEFSVRPFFGASVLILSGGLDEDYVQDRLELRPVNSPFDESRFIQRDTRIYNIRNRVGALRHFLKPEKYRRVLGLFATLIARNIVDGKTTLLVSRKDAVEPCSEYLTTLLLSWGFRVSIVSNPRELPIRPKANTIPIINYGTRGVNAYKAYDACFCLNSFYMSESGIREVLCASNLDRRDLEVKINLRKPAEYREVAVSVDGVEDRELSVLANKYLTRLELDEVIQAVGRVRPFTKPREVILFQENDLSGRLLDVTEFTSLKAVEEHFDVPDYKNVGKWLKAIAHQRLMEANPGLSSRAAARHLGIPWSTMSDSLSLARQVTGKWLYNYLYNQNPATSCEVAS